MASTPLYPLPTSTTEPKRKLVVVRKREGHDISTDLHSTTASKEPSQGKLNQKALLRSKSIKLDQTDGGHRAHNKQISKYIH